MADVMIKCVTDFPVLASDLNWISLKYKIKYEARKEALCPDWE